MRDTTSSAGAAGPSPADPPDGSFKGALLRTWRAFSRDRILAVAAECCEGRVVSVLEGGYSIPALAASVAAHVKALMEAPRAAQRSLIKSILQRQKARKNAAES